MASFRFASFNVENLFSRVRAMNLEDWSDGRGILEEYSRLNALLQKPTYTTADKRAIIDGLKALDLEFSDTSRWAILRQNRGRLVLRPKTGGITIVASGRSDWIGWVDLKRETVNETALRMTAQVVADVSANVLAVVEAEDRLALGRFDQQLLEPLGAAHDHIMLIDGNDERGIDVGLMTRGVSITSVVSHVDDVDGNQRIFSRDCPEYFLNANGQEVVVLVNHFKSKGYGSTASSNARRLAQSRRVRDIYDQRRNEGYDLIAIIGDLNDTPTSTSLTPLMTTDLRDISTLPVFVPDVPNRPGTYGNGTASQKIDYILLSPALAILATHASVNRMGVWGGKNGNLFPHYPEMTREIHAASDHAALYVDINL